MFRFEYTCTLYEVHSKEDGSIPRIDNDALLGTGGGITQIEWFNPYTVVPGATMATSYPLHGVRAGRFKENGSVKLTNIRDGYWVKLAGVDFGATGASSFSALVSNVSGDGAIELRIGSPDGTLIGTLPVRPNTVGFDPRRTITTNVSGATGINDLFLVFRGTTPDTELFDLINWQFAK